MSNIFAATALLALIGSAVSAANSQQNLTAAAQVAEGRSLFVTYCASCHGASGRGDGPVGQDFRVPPADLTQLAKHYDGVFVSAKMERIIDGRDVKAHGNVEMPIWGDVFKRREGLSEEAVKTRIKAIVKFLESIQERSS